MRNLTEANLTDAVLAKLDGTADARFKTIMTSLIRHLHAVVRETELTEAEWFAAIQYLTATGQKCDAVRQEFILLSDTLGVSMLVDAVNHRKPSGATESTVFGPFYRDGAAALPIWSDIGRGPDGEVKGEIAFVSGRVLDTAGRPLAGATIDAWQVDGTGFYDQQLPELAGRMQLRGKFTTDGQGRFGLRTVKPVSYPIPTDGPVGVMMQKMGRHPYRPAHIHMIVAAPGHEAVVTHLFAEGDPYLDSDAVFGVKSSLVVPFVAHPPGVAPSGERIADPFWTATYDFSLVALRSTASHL